jgi:chromosome segregation ATPase
MTDYSQQAFDQYREGLIAQLDTLEPQIKHARERYDTLQQEAQAEVDALEARIPDTVEKPNELQYLTRRAAQLDAELAYARRSVEMADALLASHRLDEQISVLEMRLASIDHMADTGLWATGNDPYLALAALNAQQAATDTASAVTSVVAAKERLRLTKQLHKEFHAVLRKVRRADQPKPGSS